MGHYYPTVQIGDHTLNVLSFTSAMSCYSFSLPAAVTCPGAVYASSDDGRPAICAGCYAQLGLYNIDVVRDSQALRLAWVQELLRSDPMRLENELAHAIDDVASRGTTYFRWFDSGDVFSRAMAGVIYRVMQRTPQVKHWLPTRTWHLDRILPYLRLMHRLPHVTVRPSALHFDDSGPLIPGLGRGTTAVLEGSRTPRYHRLCPKTTAPHGPDEPVPSCESVGCRKCWKNTARVAFLVHGRMGQHRIHGATNGERSRRVAACKRAAQLVQLTV